MILLIVAAGLLTLSPVSKAGFDFSYDGEKGPDHWRGQFEQCAGKYQSPINIDEHLVQKVHFPNLNFRGFNAKPLNAHLVNNGHTVLLKLETAEKASLSSGPLKDFEYIFSQLHFHWGANDSLGSEDLINNHSFPMELHMVMFKADYGTFESAVNHTDGLVVLAFFFEAGKTENPAYEEIVEALPKLIMPDSLVHLQRLANLQSLIGQHMDKYYTYHGSLTTPPCSEVVTWIDFKHPIILSHEQIAPFRKLQSHSGLMTHNNRPTQPLGGRLVWSNDNSASAATIHSLAILLALFFLCLH